MSRGLPDDCGADLTTASLHAARWPLGIMGDAIAIGVPCELLDVSIDVGAAAACVPSKACDSQKGWPTMEPPLRARVSAQRAPYYILD
jgi:hypothetical protein